MMTHQLEQKDTVTSVVVGTQSIMQAGVYNAFGSGI